jgi:ribosomal protein S18 acetylase RimI-like enzyme
MSEAALDLRPCTAEDAPVAVPLIHDSGPIAFRHVFSQVHRDESLQFLDTAFREGSGQFGWRNHLAAEREGRVDAVCAVWDARANFEFTQRAARQIIGFYGLRCPAVIWRGLRMERIVKPAVEGVAYIGHVTVAPQCRGQGIGRAMLGHLLHHAREDGYARAALDVADTNPRARALYEGLGFRVVETRRAALPERWGERVCDHHYLPCARLRM